MDYLERRRAQLAEWRKVKPRRVPIESITVDNALQSRNDEAIPLVRRRLVHDTARAHVHLIATRAKDDKRRMEPLLVAELPNKTLLLVDGFHRIEGYRRAGRKEVDARVAPMSRADAVLLSKLVNTGGEHLAMDKNQAKEAAWQFYCLATDCGKAPRGVWPSIRTIAADFGCAKCSVEAMHKALDRGVQPGDFLSTDLDNATGFPTWKALCIARRPAYSDDSPQAAKDRRLARIRKLVERMVDAMQQFRMLDEDDQDLVRQIMREDAQGGDDLVALIEESEEGEPLDF